MKKIKKLTNVIVLGYYGDDDNPDIEIAITPELFEKFKNGEVMMNVGGSAEYFEDSIYDEDILKEFKKESYKSDEDDGAYWFTNTSFYNKYEDNENVEINHVTYEEYENSYMMDDSEEGVILTDNKGNSGEYVILHYSEDYWKK